MHLIHFDNPHEFYERTVAFMAAREAENNLPLGIARQIIDYPAEPGREPYLAAAIDDNGEVAAVALMTPPHNLVVAVTDRPDLLAMIAYDLHSRRVQLPGVTAETSIGAAFADHWERLTGKQRFVQMAERIYQLEQVTPVSGVSGHMRFATEADLALVTAWVVDFTVEAFDKEPIAVDMQRVAVTARRRVLAPEQGMALWCDPDPVCMVGYGGPTPNGARVGPVYTPKPLRKRGYASACTAAVSQHLLDSGRKFVFLYTDLANPTSNKIYQDIGYRPVCDAAMLGFR
jgi:predicted GNAT family acetyltransferase